MGSSVPFEPDNPNAPINRRISILVMTKEAQERLLGQSAPVEAEPEAVPPAAAAKTTP